MKNFELKPTNNINIREATLSELKDIESVYKSNSSALGWLNYDSPNEEAQAFIKNDDLPPSGLKKNSLRLIFELKENNITIGILNYYCGFPTAESIYIGDLFVQKNEQGKGFGSTIVEHLELAAKENGYTKIYANLGLKNWPAIRFWLKRGYSNMTQVTGDQSYQAESFASIEVYKPLN